MQTFNSFNELANANTMPALSGMAVFNSKECDDALKAAEERLAEWNRMLLNYTAEDSVKADSQYQRVYWALEKAGKFVEKEGSADNMYRFDYGLLMMEYDRLGEKWKEVRGD